MRPLALLAAVFTLITLAPRTVLAAWPVEGVPIANTVSSYDQVRIEPDGPGRLVVYSFGHRNTYAYRLARRVGLDATPGSGYPAAEITLPFADGADGWFRYSSFGATPGYGSLLRLLASGNPDPAWPALGTDVPMHTPVVVSDSTSGAWVATADTLVRLLRFGPHALPPAGWNASGLALTSALPANGIRPFVKCVVDPQGRAIVLALDASNTFRTFRVLPGGTLDPAWLGGALVSFPIANQQPVASTLALEGDHFWVTWSGPGGTFAARLDSDGTMQVGWPVNALPVANDEDDDVGQTRVFPDGAGGLYAFGMEWTQGGFVAAPLHATHLSATGTAVAGWSAPGPVFEAPAGTPVSTKSFVASADGAGGVFVGWGSVVTHLGADRALVAGWAPAGNSLVLPGIVANGPCGSGGLNYSGPLAVYGDGTGFPLVATTVSDNCIWPYAALKLARFVPASFLGVTPAVPRGLSLKLLGANPASGPRRFALALAPDAPATLEVCDVAGRVVGRTFVGPGAPARELAWTPTGGARAGVYFARLAQRGAALTVRFVVLD